MTKNINLAVLLIAPVLLVIIIIQGVMLSTANKKTEECLVLADQAIGVAEEGQELADKCNNFLRENDVDETN